MPAEHRYAVRLCWTGNSGTGTSSYAAYGRDHQLCAAGKQPIAGGADPAFRGDAAHWNPEELLVASLAQCHMLWYLHLAADSGVVVTDYADEPEGVMTMAADGGGAFTRVTLRPRVAVADTAMVDAALAAHHRAHELCFIARSVNFTVDVEPVVTVTT